MWRAAGVRPPFLPVLGRVFACGARGRLHSCRRLSRLAWSRATRLRQRAGSRVAASCPARVTH